MTVQDLSERRPSGRGRLDAELPKTQAHDVVQPAVSSGVMVSPRSAGHPLIQKLEPGASLEHSGG
jgi:hypothetical protein